MVAVAGRSLLVAGTVSASPGFALALGLWPLARTVWHDGLTVRAPNLDVVAKLSALALLAGGAALWHHMHLQTFLMHVHDTLAERLPKPLRRYKWRVRSSLLQVYFGEPAVHYEVWVQRKTGTIEVGLHFEGEREENYRWAETLAARAPEILGELGPSVELEEWTQRWTRLHESRPFGGGDGWKPSRDLSEELAEEIGERLARFIEVLEPIVATERANVVVKKPKANVKKGTERRPAKRGGARRPKTTSRPSSKRARRVR